MANKGSYDYLLKLVLIGDCAGKTSIVRTFAGEEFGGNYISTIGIDFKIKCIDVDNKNVKLQVWDTSHQERFRTITSAYYRGAHGIMIVYDVTDEITFDNAINLWMKEVDRYANPDVIRMIVGNKCDLEESRAVSRERGQLVADDCEVMFTEVSAKSGYNIDQAFTEIARGIYNKIA